MKTILISIIACLLLISNPSQAQDFGKLNKAGITDKNDCIKQNDNALLCAKYLLEGTIEENENDLNHLNAMQFLMKWMEATPEYSFVIDESITKVSKSNSTLLAVYLAAMTKFVLENKDKAKDIQVVKYNSFLTLISYCQDAQKGVKMNKDLKKLIKAKEENQLNEYLKLQ